MKRTTLSRYERVMSGASRMKLQVPYGCFGGDVEGSGIRRPERRGRGGMRSRTGVNDSILQGMGPSVECREEESWGSGLKVGGLAKWLKRENRKTCASWRKGIENMRGGVAKEAYKAAVTAG